MGIFDLFGKDPRNGGARQEFAGHYSPSAHAQENGGEKKSPVSVFVPSSYDEVEHIIDALKAAGIRDKVKVMVGGAPVTQAFADEIGADIYTADAASAAEAARALFN